MKQKLAFCTALVVFAVLAFMGSPASAAVEWETNYALRSAVGPPSALPCATDIPLNPRVQACWEASGDKIWMRNIDNSGFEGVLYWSNYYPNDANLYRNGKCLNKLPDGQWGVCNKDMYENSLIKFKVCDWDYEVQMCSGIVAIRT
jgi:hypothetical protein